MTTDEAVNSPELKPLDWSSWRRVLVVVAHPDDPEYGLSCAVNRFARAGVEVRYLLLTHGEAGIEGRAPEETGPLRAAEQQAACDAVGAAGLTVLRHPDGMLTEGLDLRRDIAREIRRFRPDAVATIPFDREVPWGVNMADHRVAGLAALDACRDAGNTWVFRELAERDGLEKWQTSAFLVCGDARADVAVEVEKQDVDAGVASLACHRVYLEALPDHATPEDLVTGVAAAGGERAGVDNAITFRSIPL
ncbi:GlcNAc-PI de-N-acetylase [Corynebacterium frankenforstense DSM 45800]|uniref:GlcNAc-PI de-N-acetylase n=1 Tax=Corynebacterium frankenforstense DSM 45800 TaxID=1437875 RepID=A0A1L7CRZ6_9CORY|nr:PIG-L deacetylase family protein [Corynebacterium frankenforstense]APT88602.1 GlcNAc-PI de-N-acetylase [Corynebacterium frankenforstense DSM 45800]